MKTNSDILSYLALVLRMKNVSDKQRRENHKTHFTFNAFFFRALYKILKNTVEPDRPQMTWHMRLACWIHEATNTHSEYVIMLFHHNGCQNPPQCYVIRKSPVLFVLIAT
jgi:hypothetical protein